MHTKLNQHCCVASTPSSAGACFFINLVTHKTLPTPGLQKTVEQPQVLYFILFINFIDYFGALENSDLYKALHSEQFQRVLKGCALCQFCSHSTEGSDALKTRITSWSLSLYMCLYFIRRAMNKGSWGMITDY